MPNLNRLYDEITFEESWGDELNTLYLYFTAPVEFIRKRYTDATSMAICLEVFEENFEPDYILVRFSPTKEQDGIMTDYDWFDAYLPNDIIRKLVKLYKDHMNL